MIQCVYGGVTLSSLLMTDRVHHNNIQTAETTHGCIEQNENLGSLGRLATSCDDSTVRKSHRLLYGARITAPCDKTIYEAGGSANIKHGRSVYERIGQPVVPRVVWPEPLR